MDVVQKDVHIGDEDDDSKVVWNPIKLLKTFFKARNNPDNYTKKNGLNDYTGFTLFWALSCSIVPLITLLFLIPSGRFPKSITGTSLINYLIHILIILIISSYIIPIHNRYPGKSGAQINLVITFAVALFHFGVSSASGRFSDTFRTLLLSKQISSMNIVILCSAIGWAYIKYSHLKSHTVTNTDTNTSFTDAEVNAINWADSAKQDWTLAQKRAILRVSKDHLACDWHKQDDTNRTTQIFILIICFIIMLYPLILSWRTYSLKGTLLENNASPIFLFGLLMVLFFWDIPASLLYSLKGNFLGTLSATNPIKVSKINKNSSLIDLSFPGRDETKAKDMNNDNITAGNFKSKIEKNIEICNREHRTNYLASTGFNYLFWLLLGIYFELVRMHNNGISTMYGITFMSDALKNFSINLLMLLGTFLSTLFGGAYLWKGKKI